ncbi:MAG: hypothetical protein PHT63_05975, partial [Bacteroidales bacterium]|nr:hypothetical protein [Bacteroidales bacterium]
MKTKHKLSISSGMIGSPLLFIIATLIVYTVTGTSLFAQNRSLDDSVYDKWRNIEKCTVSQDGNVVLTEYKSHAEKEVLVIRIDDKVIEKEITGGKSVKFFGKNNSAHFFVKDTLFVLDGRTGEIQRFGQAKEVTSDKGSDFIAWFSKEQFYVSSLMQKDSLSGVKKSIFAGPERFALLCSRDSVNYILLIDLRSKKLFARDTIYTTTDYIPDISADSKGENLLFFSSADSSFLRDTEVLMINLKNKKLIYTGLDKSKLPEGMLFNVKKGISFSDDDSFFKFEISPKEALTKSDNAKNKKVTSKSEAGEKPPFEYELWRWNDTILPSQKYVKPNRYANNIKSLYYPEEQKFVRLSLGKGVFLMSGDKSPFAFELDDSPFLYEDMW